LKLIKTTLFSGIITIIRVSSGFLANKVIAIYTGTGGIALLGAFSNLISIVQTFANGAINTGVVKYTAEYEGDNDKLKSLFSTSFKISLYCSGLIGLILLFFGAFISNWIFASSLYANPVKTFGITIILYSLNSLLISILNGKKEIKTYTIVNTLASVLGLFFTLVLVYFYKIEGALYALVLSQSIVLFVSLLFITKMEWFSLDYFKQKIDIEILKKLSHYSVMAIVTALTVPVSQIVLRNMLISTNGIQSAGLWQGMIRISDGYLMILTTALATYYLPKLSTLHTDKELKMEILYGYKIILPIVFLSSLLIYTLRYYIIKLLFTQAFSQMSDLFLYQLVGDFFKMASWVLAYLMLAKSMTKIYILTEIGSALSYVIIGYVSVDYFGIRGISIAFAINYFLYLILMIYIFRNILIGRKI
jgi:O-antigen/teichoic acid export membrane protein